MKGRKVQSIKDRNLNAKPAACSAACSRRHHTDNHHRYSNASMRGTEALNMLATYLHAVKISFATINVCLTALDHLHVKCRLPPTNLGSDFGSFCTPATISMATCYRFTCEFRDYELFWGRQMLRRVSLACNLKWLAPQGIAVCQAALRDSCRSVE